jgi:repressor LexA
MAKDLSTRQRRILDYIQEHTDDRGYPPTVREIGEAVDLSSSSTVHAHLRALEESGYITRDGSLTRAIRVAPKGPIFRATCRPVPTPLVGRVAAGVPTLAEQNIEEVLPLPPEIAGGEGSFALTVRGDSMVDDGILDGDIVVVRPQQTARNGETVVALIDDEATVKRFYRENGYFRLQPANSTMDPIFVQDCLILGRVVGLLRRFH